GEKMACGEDKEQKQDPRIEGIAASIRVVPDFPKKGPSFLPKPASLLAFSMSMLSALPFSLSNLFFLFSLVISHVFKLIHLQLVGIMFQDITTLLLDPKTFKNTVDLFVERYLGKDISVVAGVSLDLLLFFSSVYLDLTNVFFSSTINRCCLYLLVKMSSESRLRNRGLFSSSLPSPPIVSAGHTLGTAFLVLCQPFRSG
ncbi:hypothetical protein BHE74_00026602, partial [Ensete ventricosum]